MKIFIFERLEKVSDNYHNEGGLIIIAKDKERVLEIIKNHNDNQSIYDKEDGKYKKGYREVVKIEDSEWEQAITYNIDVEEEKLIVFPDSGCC